MASAAQNALDLASQRPLFTNFVDFTSMLVRDIFRTLVDTSLEQLEAYVGMVEALSGGPERFIANNIGDLDAAALKYLNEVVRPTYTTDQTDYTRTGTGAAATFSPANVTLNPAQNNALIAAFAGVRVNVDSDPEPDELSEIVTTTTTTVQLSALHAFAKAMLERAGRRSFDELQALLRIGLARVVPNKGFIETALTFDIKTEDTSSTSSTTNTNTNSTIGGGLALNFIGKRFGFGLRGGGSKTTLQTKVVNENSTSTTNLNVNITGRVHIDFITDYFPLLPAATV
jgi:hypothetical protein